MGTPRPGPRRALEDRRTAAGEVAWAPVPGCGGVRWRDDRGHGFGRRGRLPRIPSAGPVGLGSLRFPAPKSPAKSFRELRALEGAGRSGAGVAGVAGAVPILGESQSEGLPSLSAAGRLLGISGQVSGVAHVIINSGALGDLRSRGSAKTTPAVAESTHSLSPGTLRSL